MAAYCRVSTDREEQLLSYENQLRYYKNYIESNPNYEFAGIYADEGITATNTKKRDNFNRMIADCRNKKIDRVITKSISRFARNTLDCLNYVRELKALGIGITFEKEGINTLESSGEVLLTILSSLAQDESRSISENTRWGIRRRYENGEYGISTKRFMGYDRDKDGKLIVNRKQAKVIKRIYEEYLSGKTVDYIKRILEREKIPKWDGTYKWQATTIQSILTNEKYKGDAELQKGHTVDFLTKTRKKNEGELQKFYIEEDHEAIIEPEVWECVQLEMQRRKQYIKEHSLNSFSVKTETNPFYGKVLCGECNNTFGRKTWMNGEKSRKVWQCNSRYRVKGVQSCCNRHIEESTVEQIFIIAWNAIIDNLESCRVKWNVLASGEDLLMAYKARDFLKLTENAEHIDKVDTDFMIRVLDNITIYESGKIIIKFYDGTEIEYC
ncbi:MAG: recombinase family protein [Clostridia bacterium]|nr:recombinase family protein [Clostridia bacterium]